MFSSPWIRKPDFRGIQTLDYDAYWDARGWSVAGKLKPREKIMLELIPKGARVIDIGCGNSLLPLKLKEKGVDVTVADVSERVLAGYRGKGIEGISLNLERIQTTALPGTFDYIILSEVLEHTKNPEEIVSVLKKHTKCFVITIPNSAAYVFRYGLMFRGRFFTQWVMHPSEHLRFWSHIDFLDWISAMGLTLEKAVVSDGFTVRGLLPKLPNIWKNFLAFRIVYVCSTKT